MIFYICFGIVWYCVGQILTTHWWTKDLDLTTNEILLMIASGFLGPFALLLFIGNQGKNSKIIILRREGGE